MELIYSESSESLPLLHPPASLLSEFLFEPFANIIIVGTDTAGILIRLLSKSDGQRRARAGTF